MFAVTILGNNSALPAHERHPTAQVVTIDDRLLLIDCGEGTQMQMSRYKIKRSKISHIFISHLHGDHYYGLIGLLTSYSLQNRETPLHIYAPPGLEKIIQLQLDIVHAILPYELVFHCITCEEMLVDEEKFSVSCFHVQHRVPCYGFIVTEKKKPRKLDLKTIEAYSIPVSFYNNLSMGEDYVTSNGEVIKNELLTKPHALPKKYAYCADTKFYPPMAKIVQGAELLYHEATYLDNLRERAIERFHSTSVQAAEFAKLSDVKKLLIGHFSSKYEVLEDFLTETVPIFPLTEIATEGVTFII
ncbi:MAG: ribonuclease Z [Bacteroidetes bacterium]|nr:ribonuclease Z [Bacteroidota bacterium]